MQALGVNDSLGRKARSSICGAGVVAGVLASRQGGGRQLALLLGSYI